jgi:putative transposase
VLRREVWLTRKGEARVFSSQVCKGAYDRGHITEEPCEGPTLTHGFEAERRGRPRRLGSDRAGNLVDVLLSETRDRAAAEAFFRSARTVTERVPERVTTDGHDSYPGAIKAELGEEVRHRTNRYLNNHLEQDHRGIKQRTRPMGGFKSVKSARRFCRVYDEVLNFLRPRTRRNEVVSLAQRRLLYTARTRVLLTSLAVA